MVRDSLVYRPYSSTEAVIQRTIEGIQRMISLHNTEGEKGTTTRKEEVIEISLAAKKHWELQIKILRDTLRDAEKLREILKEKQEEYEEATDSEVIERLIPEIEMFKFVLCLVSRNKVRE
jgi:PleD family two-component response regulator